MELKCPTRPNNEMTQNGLLKAIVEELGERAYFYMQENYNLILKHLKQNPQIVIVDEVDYLVGSKNVIEILRDIQDNTGVPIILVGMGAMDKKIARFKHFEDRIYQKIKFEHFSPDDIKEILEQITEIKFTDKLKQEYEEKLLKILKDIEKSLKLNIFSQQKECKYCEYYKLCHY